jgi:hypothetical protein
MHVRRIAMLACAAALATLGCHRREPTAQPVTAPAAPGETGVIADELSGTPVATPPPPVIAAPTATPAQPAPMPSPLLQPALPPPAPPSPAPGPAVAASAQANADCAQLVSTTLRLICATPSLEAADAAVSELYRRALANATPPQGDALREAQMRFVNSERAGCTDVQCLETAYARRLAELRAEADSP